MRNLLIITTILLAFACGTSPLAGQNLRGSVQEQDGRPVAGALVVLADSAGMERVKVLTGRDGGFVVRAPAAGGYLLRVERIGIRTPEVQVVSLFADSTVVRVIRVASQAIELPPLTAAAKRQCTSQPAQGEVVAQLWEEARKALRAVDAVQADAAWLMRIRRFERRLEPGALHVLRDSSYERLERWSATPFASAPAADLLARGFIQHTDSGTFYFAPDAGVLLSDAFAQAYCLTPREDAAAGLLGIAFRPASERGPPAVTGTLWLDARTLELRHLEFGYARVELPPGAARASGGRVELLRLPDGAWSVARWRIRFPLLVERPLGVGSARQTQQSLRSLREVGGEILEVVDRDGSVVRSLIRPSLPVQLATGLPAAEPVPVTIAVDDIETGLPLRDVSVRVGRDRAPQLTDAAGRMRLTLPPGAHEVRLEHVAYGTFVDTIRIEQPATVALRLRRAAVRLAAIEVKAEGAAATARVSRGAAAGILTRREIEPLEKRARHVGDLLRDIPGIRVREVRPARAGGITTGICIESARGDAVLRTSKCASVLVVLDGVPIPAADEMSNLPGETLRAIPPAAIESIEFIPPAEAGARYGTGSMNGVLVIYTRGNGPYAATRR